MKASRYSRPSPREPAVSLPWPDLPGEPSDPGQTDALSSPGPEASEAGITGLLDGTGLEVPCLPQLPVKISRYRVDRELARGGMGVVLAARDPELGREVAIKVLLEAHAEKPAYRQRFVDEARITARLEHPGVVPILECGQLDDNRPYFVMQFVAGQTLEALLAEREHIAEGLPQLILVFEQVCQTIAYAHSQRVIHCDLKPLNVMVAPFGAVKVTDWGLALTLSSGEQAAAKTDGTQTPPPMGETEHGIGTPAYLARSKPAAM